MSYKHISYENMQTFAAELKAKYATKAALSDVEGKADAAFKELTVSGHTVSLYRKSDKSDTPVTFDFPTEMFLDQTKTKFVDNFAWSEELYPSSTNPGESFAGKPVFVLAVRGDADGDNNAANDSVAYSFINMATLVDTYTAKTTGKDASTTVEINGYVVDVKVNVSNAEGNQLQATDAGLFVGHDSTKVDKVTSATADRIATFVSGGNIQDSGFTAGAATLNTTEGTDKTKILATEAAVAAAITTSQVEATAPVDGEGGSAGLMSANDKAKLDGIAEKATKVEASSTNGNIKVNGSELQVYDDSDVVKTGDIETVTEQEMKALLADEPAA